jgi:hypothetical protein
METPIVQEVIEELKTLPQESQRRVLEFTRALARPLPRGTPGGQLLRFAGAISSEDLKLMSQAIEQGCQRVETDDW